MNLIDNLEVMRDAFKIAHPMLVHQQGQNDEAIETVRAMQEALRNVVAEYHSMDNGRSLRWAVDDCAEALRRAEGNAG